MIGVAVAGRRRSNLFNALLLYCTLLYGASPGLLRLCMGNMFGRADHLDRLQFLLSIRAVWEILGCVPGRHALGDGEGDGGFCLGIPILVWVHGILLMDAFPSGLRL